MQYLIVAKYVGVDQPVRLVETLEQSQELAEILYDDHAKLLADYPESILEVDAPDYMGIEVLTVDDRGITGKAVVVRYRTLPDFMDTVIREREGK